MRDEGKLGDGPGRELLPERGKVREDAVPKGYYIDDNIPTWEKYVATLQGVMERFEATDDDLQKRAVGSKLVPDMGRPIAPFKRAIRQLVALARETHERGAKVIFIGNGGSAAIASHMAVDWTKNGGIRSVALNDVPTLTCIGNDFGYEQVFAKQLEYYSAPDDLVIIVSSSGRSPNVLATGRWCSDNLRRTVTLSGMEHTNLLRRMGVLNFYVPSRDYGTVELAHLFLLHSVVTIRW